MPLFALNADDRRSVGEASASLEDLTTEERPLLTIAGAIKALALGAQSVIQDWSGGGTAGALAFTGDPRLRHLRDYPNGYRLVPGLAKYRRDGRDPSQHRVVDFLTACEGDRERMDLCRRLVYGPLDVCDQLRVLVGEPGQGVLTCCLLFPTAGADRNRELARLQALVPALRDATAVYRALGTELSSLSATALSLDAFDEPAWLCSERGRVLHRNEAAQLLGDSTPACVLAAARGSSAAPPCTRVRRLWLDDRPAVLVLLSRDKARSTNLEMSDVQGSPAFARLLPAALAAVAGLIAAGLSDEQIARALGRPLATVRTYVVRIYRRLGIHGRAELVHLAREESSITFASGRAE